MASRPFGTVNLRFVVPHPERCPGCMELLARSCSRGQLRGKVHAVPESNVIKYRRRITLMRCPTCGSRFKHTYYEVLNNQDDD